MSKGNDQASRLREMMNSQEVASIDADLGVEPDVSEDVVDTQASRLIRLVNLSRPTFSRAQEAA